jgi:hypothetical protein
MSSPKNDPRGEACASKDKWILLISGCVALAPYLIYQSLFRRMFWFGDEFDLIDQFDRIGFWRWVWLVFAENFVPLFKVLWGGSVLLFGGSYCAMLALVWLTHALNVALLGRLMRGCGISWAAVFLAQIVFGLTPANYETLAWSVQWSAMLSVTFMLLALDNLFRSAPMRAPFVWAVMSALSFSRGVLTGPLVTGACLFRESRETWSRRAGSASIFLVPAFVVGGLIVLLARGNQQHMGGHIGEAAIFGLWYYCLNPAYSLLSTESWGWHTVAALGILKVAISVLALVKGTQRQRVLFAVLVAFDVGNAVLLGIGRYHTGLGATVASRYQYASLVATMPLAACWLAIQWDRVPGPAAVRRLACSVILGAIAVALCQQWQREIGPFSSWRGADSRRILFVDSAPDAHSVPGIPGLPMSRAKELIAKYHLH